ncbi:MAG: transporter, partial [Chthoniobacterales bacterium]
MLNAQTKPGKTITIDALIVQALANNAELRFYEAEIEAAKGVRRTAGSWQNPQFAGEIGAKRTVGDGIDATGIAWATAFQQTFEWPGRVSLRKNIA